MNQPGQGGRGRASSGRGGAPRRPWRPPHPAGGGGPFRPPGRRLAGVAAAWGLLWGAAAAAGGELFPFVLPWDLAPAGVADLSHLHHRPAGARGPVRVGADGHLYAGAERIRFWGINVTGDSAFPPRAMAPAIARRLARAGFNVVRFHHLDNFWSPSLIDYAGGTSRALRPEHLDALDYFVAQLRQEGVYVNFNLLVSRWFSPSDGLPPELEQIPDFKVRHCLGFFFPPLVELQREYARQLLAHRNPYTGTTYAREAAVAFVEIQNENGLLHCFLGGALDHLPAVFHGELQRQWNGWLLARYGSTAALRQAWGHREEPLGPELLRNTDLAAGLDGWFLETHAGAEALATVVEDAPAGLARAVRLEVTRPGGEGWHVQWGQGGLEVREGALYTLSFWARASAAEHLSAAVAMAHPPWQALSPWYQVPLGPTWRRFEYTFVAPQDDWPARVIFSDLARRTGSFWLAGVSLRPGGALRVLPAGQALEDGTVATRRTPDWGAAPAPVQRDWLRFLLEREEQYWGQMRRFLREELGVVAPITGTSIGCSTPNLMAAMDYVDTHSYWQHPEFPGGAWDPRHWFIRNLPMVNAAGGAIATPAVQRVLGRPHALSEYNHPAPNTFTAEGPLLAAAYAALQDWDAVYFFDYAATRAELASQRIGWFFDSVQHPPRWVSLVAGAALFLRGDVAPARRLVVAPLPRAAELEALRHSWAWRLADGTDAGLRPAMALVHRLAVAVEGQAVPPGALRPEQVEQEGPVSTSDTGQLRWDRSDPSRGLVTVATPRSKAVVGFGAGRELELGDGVRVAPGPTRQGGFAVIALTVLEGSLTPPGPARLLVIAAGHAENTSWGWQELGEGRVTLEDRWGSPPVLVEGIPAELLLPAPAAGVRAWALDERGERGAPLPVRPGPGGRAVVELGPRHRTLWYEVELAWPPRLRRHLPPAPGTPAGGQSPRR